MFKKIHSNRDPKDTIYSELKKEYSIYFEKSGALFQGFSEKYPKQIYIGMVGLIIVSLILSFTVFSVDNKSVVQKEKISIQQKAKTEVVTPVSDGFNNIVETSSKLRETIKLKNEIETIIAKKALTNEDSLFLQNALNRLQEINKPLNKKK
ncbi:hypothetical protein FA048_12740 [Pedobacter polaris]|uniref:Uncharacterized protein n=1 Tax=Pedobacter polaris TaxID=2571273 RepID=A0A4U1CK56_9SPHI|nr:hypothetical protein [Pedobacter polaris]TKC08024.1 hypothetical protein FA048_12740 [Pedobacter polaris]